MNSPTSLVANTAEESELRHYIEQQAAIWAHLPLEETFEQIELHVLSNFPDAGEYEARDIMNDVMIDRVLKEVR